MGSSTHADTAIVQNTVAVTSANVTLAAPVGVGDVLCAVWGSPSADTDTISDSAGVGSWIKPLASAGFSQFAYCIAAAAAPGGTVITTSGSGSGARFMVADRFTVKGGRARFRAAANFGISGTTGIMGTIASGLAGGLLWGALHADDPNSVFTAGSSGGVAAVIGSQVGNGSGSGMSEYITSTAGGQQQLSWSSTVSLAGREGWQAYFSLAAPSGLAAALVM